MTYRVALSPSSFAAEDDLPLRLLQDAGVEVIRNPFGRRLTEDEALCHLQGVDGLVAGLEPLTRRVLVASRRLKAIARVGIGLDNVDLKAARELGIRVSNTPDAPSRAVAELTVAAALSLSRDLKGLDQAMHEGRWVKSIARGLWDCNVLIIGLGRIGRQVADLMRAFGARVSAVDPYLPRERFGEIPRPTLDDGLSQADIVSLHAAGRDTVIGPHEFSCMRQGAWLLNSARAELVDENALIGALDSGKVGGAWFDVFWEEPYGGRLRAYPHVLLTPHVGTYTTACRRDMEAGAVRNLLRDLRVAELRSATVSKPVPRL